MLMYFIYLLTIRFYLLFVFGVSEVLIQTHLFFIKWHASAFLRIIFVKINFTKSLSCGKIKTYY